MDKRGQIYIIAALILSVVIFLLLSQTNFVQRILIEDDFEQISQNFDIESAKFMNSLLTRSDPDVSTEFTAFTSAFTDYVKVENPEFEYVYVLDYKEEKLAGGFVKNDIMIGNVTIESRNLPEGILGQSGLDVTFTVTGDVEVEPITDTSTITIEDTTYMLNIEPGAPQIIIISREEKAGQVKVYLNEEFIEGEKLVGG